MSRNTTYRFPFPKFPAVRVALFMAAGIVIAHLTEDNNGLDAVFLILFTVLLVSFIVIEWWGQREFSGWKVTTSILLYSLLIVTFGGVLYTLDEEKNQRQRMLTEPLQLYEWETVGISGQIRERGRSSSGREVFVVDVYQTRFPGDLIWHQKYRIRLYGSQEMGHVEMNHQQMEAKIRLYAFPETRNPHEFDYGKWLLSKQISAHGEIEQIVHTEPGQYWSWQPLRENILHSIDQLFGEKAAPLAKALFVGNKQELTPEVKSQFARAGLSHIMAVSGMHVGFVVAPFWLLIPWLWRNRYGKPAGLILLTLLLFLYAGLTGFSASVSRASVMAWLLTYGKLYHKMRESVNLLGAAAIILLVWKPSQLFDVGFQLSFSAVLVILLVMPMCQHLVPRRIRYQKWGALATIVLISVVVQAGLFPILAHYFGEFSIAGPVANALVVPLLGVIVPAGLACAFTGIYAAEVVHYLAVPLGWGIIWIETVAGRIGGAEQSYFSVPELSPFIFLVWAFGVLFVAALKVRPYRWKIMILFLISLNVFVADQFIVNSSGNELRVTFLDVGQGDAIHIQTPNRKHILIDAGRWSPGGDSGERVLAPYLEYVGADKLDAVILSHPHADHIGGIRTLMNDLEIEQVYQSNFPYDSKLYQGFLDDASRNQIPIRSVAAGDQIKIDPAIRMFVLGPDEKSGGYRNANNHSVVLRLDYGTTTFLFTGDAEEEQEREIEQMYGDFLDTDLLKVAHHGSKTSSTSRFLERVKPDIAVASLAFRNRFGHPGRETVIRLERSGAKNYFTSLSGALIFRSDGENIVTAPE